MPTYKQRFVVDNRHKDQTLELVVEPWAESFEVPCGSTASVQFESGVVGDIVVDFGNLVLSVWAWDDCKVTLEIDGKDVTSSVFSIPVPRL